jgi:hypothetical protein
MQMIRLHEQRHEQHENTEADLKDDIKELHSRITTVNRELHEKIDQVERHITERLDAIRSDLAVHKKNDEPKSNTDIKRDGSLQVDDSWCRNCCGLDSWQCQSRCSRHTYQIVLHFCCKSVILCFYVTPY